MMRRTRLRGGKNQAGKVSGQPIPWLTGRFTLLETITAQSVSGLNCGNRTFGGWNTLIRNPPTAKAIV
ncbi:MAG: hypothetical protein ACWGMZ_13270 [Thermoguttaceae bacterium]